MAAAVAGVADQRGHEIVSRSPSQEFDPNRHRVAGANQFNEAKGAMPVTLDGDLGAAWIAAGEVKVAFVFHVEAGLVHEVELLADPEILATLTVERVRRAT